MYAHLSFAAGNMARLHAPSTRFGIVHALFAIAHLVLVVAAGVLCLSSRDEGQRVLGGFFLLSAVGLAVLLHRVKRRTDAYFQIDKVRLAVHRSDRTGRREIQTVEAFLAVRLSIAPGTDATPRLAMLQLECDDGVMRLFTTPARDNAVQVGRSLAAWLRVPFLDEATADVPPLKPKKILFHQGW
jgi:hypothetical protein